LRSEYETQLKLWCNLEYSVETAFIDIVIGIEDWIFAIENKIYPQSISAGQLSREYEGLKKKNPDSKIGMIYLVPIEGDGEIVDGKIEKEFDELSEKENDFKAFVTWQKNNIDNVPSISKIIGDILDDESKGIIDPVSEYTRHTLKALNSFISNDFAGYEYEREFGGSGLNPETEKQLSVAMLKNENEGYVGVKGGIRGLLKMEEPKIKIHKFQYTTQDMSEKPNWIEIKTFNDIIKWVLYKEIKDIDWKGNLHSESLYKIAKDYKEKVFIGIKGGEKALKNMEPDQIKNKGWGISTVKATAQWIDGELFCKIIDEKEVF
jgi:hypothetical protein